MAVRFLQFISLLAFTNGNRLSRNKKFRFLPGLTHTFTSDVVEPTFCDNTAPLSHSGYMDITGSEYDDNGDDKHLFFWFTEKRALVEDAFDIPLQADTEGVKVLRLESEKSHKTSTFRRPSETYASSSSSTDTSSPLILWLTGGPGCSSSLAALTENGPCMVNEAGDGTDRNSFAWNEVAHILYLDQPSGVGFSYGEHNTDRNEAMISEDVYYFLQSFFQAYPEYLNCELFVVGESYGGHYVPAIAHRIYMGNKNEKDGIVKLNLTGLAIGNGYTDPAVQSQYYAEMANYNSQGIQTVSQETYEKMKANTQECVDLTNQCNDIILGDTVLCLAAFDFCSIFVESPYYKTGLNPYDIRLECGDFDLCYDFTNLESFMNLPSTRENLHIPSQIPQWTTCDNNMGFKFSKDQMKNFSPYVAELLNAGVRALIYAGDADYSCNYMGNRAWTMEMEWDFKDEFNNASDHDWFDGYGLARSANGLSFLQVYDAGHMVPSDKPEVALQLIRSFLADDEF